MAEKTITELAKKVNKKSEEKKEYTESKHFLNEEIDTMLKYPEIFFFASRARIILVIDIFKHARKLFESYSYTAINVDIELYEYLRNCFHTKAFNKTKYTKLFRDNKTLSYKNFVELESYYIALYNKTSESHVPTATHISLKKTEASKEVFSVLKDINISEKQKKILLMRSNGKTLDKVGAAFNITRERIRQIEIAPKKHLLRWLSVNEAEIQKNICFNGKIVEDKAKSFFGEDIWTIVKYVIKTAQNSEHWKYFEDIDIYFWLESSKSAKEIFDIAGQCFVIGSCYNDIKDEFLKNLSEFGINFMSDKNIKDYIAAQNFQIFNNKIYEGKMTLGKAIELVVESDFPNGIKITDKEEVNKLYSILEKDYNIHSSRGRAFTTRIEDILIMRDRAVYDIPARLQISKKLKTDLVNYIYNMEEDRIPYKSLFSVFKERLSKESNIDNHYYLHGLFKLLEPENNITCLRYYICKSEIKDAKSKDFFQQLNDYLLDKGRPLSVNEILKDFPSWNKDYIKYAMTYFDNIVIWEKDYYFNMDCIKTTAASKRKLKDILERLLDNDLGYTSSYFLYKVVSDEYKDFLKKNNINNENQLFNLAEHIFKNDFSFSKPHILKDKNCSNFTTNDLISSVIEGNTFNRKNVMIKLQKYYGCINSSLNLALQKKIKDYVHVSQNEYFSKNSLNLTKKKIIEIRELLKDYEIKNSVILLSRIKNFSKFPKIGCDWSSFVLTEIVKLYNFGYTPFMRTSSSSSVNLCIALTTDSFNPKDKIELLRWLLINDFDQEKTKTNILKYVKDTNIFSSSFAWGSIEPYLSDLI